MRKDVAELIGQMHLFAFSTTPDEGLGIALIEAMAAGVPVIASDVGACREVLDNGRLGTLVTPADPLALADAIDAVIADAGSADARAQLAREKVLQAFSITDMARRYAALLGLPANETPSCRAEPKLGFAG
jgi:glycosyltransferase involved in cell wall biosynthesis